MRARENPFRVERQHALRFRFPAGEDHESLLARAAARGGRGAIVGPHGSGKTTLLLELAEQLRARGHRVRELRIGAPRHSLTHGECAALSEGLGPRDAVLFDGAGHLAPWHWWSLARALRPAAFVLVSSHRAGRLPTLLRTQTSFELLRELALELAPGLEPERIDTAWRSAGGDLRAALRGLFEVCAGREGG